MQHPIFGKVLTKDVLMDILQRYMHLDVETKVTVKNGKETKKIQKLIFPDTTSLT